MNQDRINEIEDRIKKASEGPWEADFPIDLEWTQEAHDFNFISHARQDVPDLIDEIRSLWSEREYWKTSHSDGVLKKFGLFDEFGSSGSDAVKDICIALLAARQKLKKIKDE